MSTFNVTPKKSKASKLATPKSIESSSKQPVNFSSRNQQYQSTKQTADSPVRVNVSSFMFQEKPKKSISDIYNDFLPTLPANELPDSDRQVEPFKYELRLGPSYSDCITQYEQLRRKFKDNFFPLVLFDPRIT